MVSEENFQLKICPFCQAKNRVQSDKADRAICGVCKHRLMATHYDVLGVNPDASMQEIKHQYRRMVQTWHPDKTTNDPRAVERFKAIVEAYRTLSDPEKRQQYDEVLRLDEANTDEVSSIGEVSVHPHDAAGTATQDDSDDTTFVMKVFYNVLLFCSAFILFILWVVTSHSDFPGHDVLLWLTIILGMYSLFRTGFIIVTNWNNHG
jgi:DnaJ domain